ncbi:MAG: GTP-binding protein, partial [Cyclobacteriaceae bacterium]|nr:GTP-binding protein [Cyclobacteriaceae bacterium]
MRQIPFFLVTGFLGSGKTTFLKRILKKYATEKKIAIIQNEFAPANIDGAELKREGKKF